MSRDGTPRQTYDADKHMRYTPEEPEFRKQYPLFGLTFPMLWQWYSDQDDKRRAKIVIEMVEKKLAAYTAGNSEKTDKLTTVQKWFERKRDIINAMVKAKLAEYIIDNSEKSEKTDKLSTVLKWLEREFMSDFYYNADNHAMYEHLTGMYYAISTEYIYLVVGRSGSGKTTVTNILHELFALNTVESFTTRPPRYENEPGHTFVSKEDFDKIPMVAYTMFNGYEYGVPEEMVDKAQLYVIDIPGVKTLQERYVGKPIKTVYIDCDKERLRKRMLERGDSEETVTKRMANDDVMFAEEDTFPFDVRIDGTRTAAEVAADIAAFIVQTEGNSVI